MKEINDFFKRHNFNPSPVIEEMTDILLEDMKNGLQKNYLESSSMDMIPIWKTVSTECPKNKSVITIDAGGTNFRAALIKFSDTGNAEIVSFLKKPMPALDREMTNREFFDKLAEYLEALKNKAESISFCFSFAIKIFPDGSGEAIKLSKEIKLPELAGCKINEELFKALKLRGWTKIKRVVMVNDTASVLQAGILSDKKIQSGGENLKPENLSGFVGFVLGTGLNSAYIEYGEIEKIKDSPYYIRPQIIVCESGKCNKVPQSSFDKELSRNSKLPNEYFLERMCSGRYLGELCSIILRTAAKENLFSPQTNKKLIALTDFSTEKISDFLKEKDESFSFALQIKSEPQDLEKIRIICNAVFTRSAIMSAAILASACIKMDKGKARENPICISADGSVFLKGFSIEENIEKVLKEFLTDKKGIHFIIRKIENPVTLGSSFF